MLLSCPGHVKSLWEPCRMRGLCFRSCIRVQPYRPERKPQPHPFPTFPFPLPGTARLAPPGDGPKECRRMDGKRAYEWPKMHRFLENSAGNPLGMGPVSVSFDWLGQIMAPKISLLLQSFSASPPGRPARISDSRILLNTEWERARSTGEQNKGPGPHQ